MKDLQDYIKDYPRSALWNELEWFDSTWKESVEQKCKDKGFITIKEFTAAMRKFEPYFDFAKIENAIYEKKCGKRCLACCGCFKGPCKWLRNFFRKGRLKNLRIKQPKDVLGGIIYAGI